MNILRGTFRLSFVVAAVTVGYLYWDANIKGGNEAASSAELWRTLRCGKRLVGKDTTAYQNEYGLIDLSKIGCSDRRFLAHEHEIKSALENEDPYMATFKREQGWRRQQALYSGIFTFIVTNLLGLVVVGGLRVFRWVAAGYRA